MPKSAQKIELTPKEEILHRIDGLKRGMAEAGIDFSVILQNVDMFYFTGTVQKGIRILAHGGKADWLVAGSSTSDGASATTSDVAGSQVYVWKNAASKGDPTLVILGTGLKVKGIAVDGNN